MKILMVTGTFRPRRFGGVTEVSYNFSKRLVKNGHEVSVYTTDVGNDCYFRLNVPENKIVDGIYVHYFRNINNSLAFTHRIFLSIGMFFTIRKDITNFDVIHVHELRGIQEILIRHYAKKYNIPYIIQAHGSLHHSFQKQRLKKIFDLLFGYKILRDASKVIALNKTEAEQYISMGVDKHKIETIPNGISIERGYLPFRGEFRKKYLIADTDKIILYLGRLHRTKGIDLIIKAFAETSKEVNNIWLVLVGPDDGYQSALEELIQRLKVGRRVIFTGFVSNEEKMEALVDADVFVTPNFTGFPLTFLEACACGIPIITTVNGDELDWIQNKVGYIVAYNVNKLCLAIANLLNDDRLRHRFGEEGKRLAREEFGWDKVIKKLENVYANCVYNGRISDEAAIEG